MIARTYYVVMPTAESGTVALDIVLEAYPGSQGAPIAAGNAPAGWNGGNGSYYEIRSRPVRLPVKSGDDGFVPRFRLGWTYSASRVGTADGAVPGVQFSETLQAALNSTPLADPTYGPVIRLSGLQANVGGGAFVVQLEIMQAKDEDRTDTGT